MVVQRVLTYQPSEIVQVLPKNCLTRMPHACRVMPFKECIHNDGQSDYGTEQRQDEFPSLRCSGSHADRT